MIGQSDNCKVYKVYDMSINDPDNRTFAIKTLPIAKIKNEEKIALELEAEKASMLKCNGENVVFAKEILESNKNVYIIMPICTGGDLRKKLNNNNGKIGEFEAHKILFQLINGMKELEMNKICHRFITPENIFLHKNLYKISDFSYSEIYDSKNQKMNFYNNSLYSCP